MKIDCGRCETRGAGCQDCVITVLGPAEAAGHSAQRPGYLGEAPGYLGEAEVRALGVLAAAGLVPPLRFSPPGSTVLPGARAWTRRSFPDTKAS
jgi:hypothetical protein